MFVAGRREIPEQLKGIFFAGKSSTNIGGLSTWRLLETYLKQKGLGRLKRTHVGKRMCLFWKMLKHVDFGILNLLDLCIPAFRQFHLSEAMAVFSSSRLDTFFKSFKFPKGNWTLKLKLLNVHSWNFAVAVPRSFKSGASWNLFRSNTLAVH